MKGDKWCWSDPHEIDREIGSQNMFYKCCSMHYKCTAIFFFLEDNFSTLSRAHGRNPGRPRGTCGPQKRLDAENLCERCELRKRLVTVGRQCRLHKSSIANIGTRAWLKRWGLFVRAWNGSARWLRRLQLRPKERFKIERQWRKLEVVWRNNKGLLGGSGRCIF